MKNILFIICTLISFQGLGQVIQKKYPTIDSVYSQNKNENFNSFQKEMKHYFEENPDDKSGYKKWKRNEWFLEQRFYPSGEIENISEKNYRAFRKYAKEFPDQIKNDQSSNERSPHGSWSFQGPFTTTAQAGQGRINSIDILPANDNVIWVTSPNGGIWRTINGGSSWSNMTSTLPLLAFADLEIHPTNGNIIYALTGDGDPAPGPNNEHGQGEVRSIGVIVSYNGGASWQETNFSFDESSSPVIPTQLLMHPFNPNIQYIAAKNGIYKTTNAWATSTQVFTSTVYDIEFKPGSPNTMYAARTNSLLRSTNGGDTWTTVSDADFSSFSGATRVELAVSANQPNWVYAMAGDWSGGSKSIMASYNSGVNNSWVIRDQTTNVIGAFATYCIALTADPSNANRIFGAGVGTWRSNTGGSTGSWLNVSGGSIVHPDVHDLKYQNGVIYVASDGGLHKSTNNGATWSDLSAGLGVTEIYRLSGSTSNSNLYFMGTQDNGTYRKNSFSQTFTRVLGADGMDNFVNWANPNIVFACTQNGGINRSTNGGSSFSGVTIPDGGNWITPILQDPTTSTNVFVGKDNLYRSFAGGVSGSFISVGSPWSGSLHCIAQGKSFNNRFYASSFGAIYRSDNILAGNAASVSWTNVTSGLPGNFITDIAVDPANSQHVIVTVSGYNDGQKIYESFSSGSLWNNITGSLPNVPVNCIEIHDGAANVPMYIGTDVGVFYRSNAIGDWIYFSDFLPNVVVNDLYINPVANTIAAGTYGRGLWRSDLKSGCFNSISFSSGVTHQGMIDYAYDVDITSSATVSSNLGTSISYQAGQAIQLNEGFRALSGTQFEAKLGPCPN